MEPFKPPFLPLKTIDYSKLIRLVGQANAELARYDGLLSATPGASVFLSPLENQEAVLSSRIEGTQATIEDVLEHEAGKEQSPSVKNDIQDIINYREASLLVTKHVAKNPISLNLILHLHKILMDSTRGKDKNPGAFRTDQNWIGLPGASLQTATYVPVSPLVLGDYLENWQQYIESDDSDPIIQTAIIHAQFELIHPFSDGNGRIGRLLIPLILYRKKAIQLPNFYISEYLEKNRTEYYSGLKNISQKGDWMTWIEFFLGATKEQSKTNTKRIQLMIALYDEMKSKIIEITHSTQAIKILDALFDKPIFRTSELSARTAIPKQSVFPLLKKLKEHGILKVSQESSGRQAGILAFQKLLDIIRSD